MNMLKMAKRLFLTIAIFCGLLAIASCNSSKAVQIRLDSSEYEVKIGETIKVNAEVTKDGAAVSADLGYKSSDPSIATFVNGKLTGISEGTTEIKVYSVENPLYDAVATVTVKFSQSLQADFRYNKVMYKGDLQVINFNLALDSQNAIVSFKSADESIVSVDQEGNILAIGAGATEIIARVTNAESESQYREFVLPISVEGVKSNITYKLNGGTPDAELPEYYIEGVGVELPGASKDGYEFLGWFMGEKPVLSITPDMVGYFDLSANWSAIEYSISYELNEGEFATAAPSVYTVEQKVELPAPTRPGFDFVGWYDNAEFEGEALEAIELGSFGDKELFAKWELEKFDVTLELDGGHLGDSSLGNVIQLNIEDEIPTPVKPGYEFIGWYIGEEQVFYVDSDCTITAKWELGKYTVILDLNGGIFGGEITSISQWGDIFLADFNKAAGTSIKKDSFQKNSGTAIKTAFSNEEFYNEYKWVIEFALAEMEAKNVGVTAAYCTDTIEFLRAMTVDFASCKAMVNNGSAPGPNGRTCFRVWLESLINETLSYANSAYTPYCTDFSLPESQARFWNVYFDTEYVLTVEDELPVAIREGYNFLGWYKGEEKVEHAVESGVLVAKWELKTFAINYDLNGGQWGEEQGPASFGYNEFAALVDPVREGYKFLGWISNDKYVTEINKNEEYNLVAKWKANDAAGFEILFDLNGGAFADESLKLQQTILPDQELPTPVKEHYVFLGWYAGEEKIDVVRDDHVLVAKWIHEDEVEYTVEFDLAGGSFQGATLEKFAQEMLDLFNSTNVGDEEVTTLEEFCKTTHPNIKYVFAIKENLIKYKWLFELAIKEITIASNASGKSSYLAETVEMLNGMIAENTSTITGSYANGRTIFRYWLEGLVNGKKPTGRATYDGYTTDYSDPVKMAEFLALYSIADSDVTFTPIEKLPTPFYEGHLFLGWYNGEEKVEQVRGNWKLVAKWAKFEDVKYHISYDLAGGQWGEVQGVTEFHYGQEVTLVAPVKDGYKFLGWYNSEDKEVKTISNNDYALTAKWEEIPEEEYVPVVRLVDPNNSEAYATIEAALAEAKPGDTIKLVAGSYTSVALDVKNITLAGPNAGINPVTDERLEEAVFTGDVTIVTEGVTVDGILITEKGRIVGDTMGVKNATIKNVYSYASTVNPDENYSEDAPINFFTNVEGAYHENITLAYIKYEGSKGRPMIFYGAQIDGLTVRDCQFVGTRQNYNDGIKISGTGVEFGIRGNVNITNNHFENYSQYVIWFIMYGAGTYNVLNNTFLNCGQTAASHTAIRFDRFVGEATEIVNINFCYNTVNNSYSLIRLDKSGTTSNVNWSNDDRNAQNLIVKVNNNKLLVCNATYYVNNKFSFAIDATNNWYDVEPVDGKFNNATWKPFYASEEEVPGYVDLENTLAINYELGGGTLEEGAPDRFRPDFGLAELPQASKKNCVFEGWLLNGELVTSLPKGLTEEVTLVAKWREDALYVGVGEDYYYATITEALAAAEAGDTIVILAGEYNENITISVSNLTIKGPNAGINPNKNERVAEAVLTGTVTIATAAKNVTIDGLAFTGAAKVVTTRVFGLTFKNNYAYDTAAPTAAWKEATGYVSGFVSIGETAASQDVQFVNNRFENVKDVNVNISDICNVSFDGNVFKNFGYDAIRFDDSTYEYGYMSFTNNEFVNDTPSGYNGIYFRSYGGANPNDTKIVIIGNKFVNIGNATNAAASVYVNAISARNNQENGTVWVITDNYFESCYNYIRLRNNYEDLNKYKNYEWSCKIENNQFIGLPASSYFAIKNGTSADTDTNCPSDKVVFGANYYEDGKGNVITDLSAYAAYFKDISAYGTALSAKPGDANIEVLEFYSIQYELDGGTAEGTFVYTYSSLNDAPIAIPAPEKANHQFMGWEYNGTLVTEIPADARGDLVLVASYKVLEGEVYSISFVDERNLGVWPTKAAKDQYEIAELLLADMYEWQTKYKGVTTDYETWAAAFIASLKAGTNEKVRNVEVGPFADENGNTEFFLNIPEYYEKWMPFFAILDEAIQAVNASQGLWKDAYAAHMRIGQFLDWSKPNYYESYLGRMREAVRIKKEVVSSYRGGQIVELPVLTSKIDLAFLGWYDNAEFTGNPITSIVATDTGDKTFYAKWEAEIVATKVELNVIEKLERFGTHQLVWSFDPANTTNQSVEFFSSDESIASVGLSNGLITAHKDGEVTITMKVYGNRELDVVFSLTVYSPDHIEGSYETESVVVKNETIKLNAENAYNKEAGITWSTSNADVAYVDATSGVVTGVKAGTAIITATSKAKDGSDIKLDFIVVVVEEELTGILDFLANQNEANVFTRYSLYIDGNAPFYADIFGSVNRVLFKEYKVDTTYVQAGVDSGRYYTNSTKNEGLEFITVHYTANNSASAGAKTHANYFTGTGTTTSIHYTTGNDGVYQALTHEHGAYHAGDSDSVKHSNSTKVDDDGNRIFTWMPTGVMYTGDGSDLAHDMLNVEWTISDDMYFEINGQKTSVPLPQTWNYSSRNTDHIYNNDGTITAQSDYTGSKFTNKPAEEFINDQDLPVTVIDGQYYMGPTWWCYTQVHEGRICASGGNRNSIGIETAVNAGKDLWLTWQMTAQLVADLMEQTGLDISRVKGHHFFSGKNCPQPMLQNDLEIWWEFVKLVEAEYELRTKYADYTITCVSNNPDIVDNTGRVVKQPEYATSVSYTLTITDGSGNVQTITLASMIQGIYQK